MKPHLKWNGECFLITNPSYISLEQLDVASKWADNYFALGKQPYNARDAQ